MLLRPISHRKGTGLRLLLILLGATSSGAIEAAPAWSAALRQPSTWYQTSEAKTLALAVTRHQLPCGGWAKNIDLFGPPQSPSRTEGTFDNEGTIQPLRFLAAVLAGETASPGETEETLFAAFDRGVRFVLDAQYPGGGWPQYFPLRDDYSALITYNDHAMLRVLEFLRDITRSPRFAFVDPNLRARAETALGRGVTCVLQTQVRQGDTLTAWCAQHDPVSLAPAGARSFEPSSLSGAESVGLIRFLMQIEQPDPDVVAAVEGAIAWLDKVKITGWRVESFTDEAGLADRRLVPAPNATPLWARFYTLDQHLPLYMGRDGVPHSEFSAIERERRAGYAYHGSWAAELLAKDYPRWKEKHLAARPCLSIGP
ncbi:MAG: pectate lyase [Opitutaceae bacterium]|jgi:PelA/Pel-15E family pectate lyase|nr:pectate lyase [Opitutaceae bacterium]